MQSLKVGLKEGNKIMSENRKKRSGNDI